MSCLFWLLAQTVQKRSLKSCVSLFSPFCVASAAADPFAISVVAIRNLDLTRRGSSSWTKKNHVPMLANGRDVVKRSYETKRGQS